jgi:hypothetical protein
MQDGCNYRYYGYNADAANKTVMVDPQVYLAYNGSAIEMPKAPEFVVTVNVAFESNGNTMLFSKCFVPKIQLIDRATTLQKRDALQQYHDNSQNGQPTGSVANASSIPVYSPDGDRLIKRTLTNTTEGIRSVNEYSYNSDDEIKQQTQKVFDKNNECIVSITMKNNYTAHDDEGNWTKNELKLMYWEKDQQPQNMNVTQTRTISYWEDD